MLALRIEKAIMMPKRRDATCACGAAMATREKARYARDIRHAYDAAWFRYFIDITVTLISALR